MQQRTLISPSLPSLTVLCIHADTSDCVFERQLWHMRLTWQHIEATDLTEGSLTFVDFSINLNYVSGIHILSLFDFKTV